MCFWGEGFAIRGPVCACLHDLSFLLPYRTCRPVTPASGSKDAWNFRPPTWQPEEKEDHSRASQCQRVEMFASFPGFQELTIVFVTELFTHLLTNFPVNELTFCQSLKFILRVRVESYFHTSHKEETQENILKENTSFWKAMTGSLREYEHPVPMPGPFHIIEMCDHTDRKLNKSCPAFLLLINH